jgi:hypothetical protein
MKILFSDVFNGNFLLGNLYNYRISSKFPVLSIDMDTATTTPHLDLSSIQTQILSPSRHIEQGLFIELIWLVPSYLWTVVVHTR